MWSFSGYRRTYTYSLRASPTFMAVELLGLKLGSDVFNVVPKLGVSRQGFNLECGD